MCHSRTMPCWMEKEDNKLQRGLASQTALTTQLYYWLKHILNKKLPSLLYKVGCLQGNQAEALKGWGELTVFPIEQNVSSSPLQMSNSQQIAWLKQIEWDSWSIYQPLTSLFKTLHFHWPDSKLIPPISGLVYYSLGPSSIWLSFSCARDKSYAKSSLSCTAFSLRIFFETMSDSEI